MNGPRTEPGTDRLANGALGASGAEPGGRATSVPLMGHAEEPTIFELSSPGAAPGRFRSQDLPEWKAEDLVPARYLAPEPVVLAEVSERDLVAHYTRLSHRQYSVDLGAYPLGSCTMKYNPKLCDEAAGLPGLADVTPAHRHRSSRVGWSCSSPSATPCAR